MEACRRAEAEKSALDTRATLLAPQFRALDEGRAALEGARRDGELNAYCNVFDTGSMRKQHHLSDDNNRWNLTLQLAMFARV